MPVYQEKDKNKWTKDGRSWHFRVNYVNAFNETKQKESKLFFTKKEALEEERKFLLNNDHKQNNTKITLDKLYEEYEKYLSITKNKSSSIYSDYLNYQNHIQPTLGKMNVSKISLQTIRSFHTIINNKTYTKNNVKHQYGHKFKTKIHSLLSCILDYGVTMGYIEENMAKRHGNFKTVNDEVTIEKEKIKYQTPAQFNDFMAFVDEDLWKAFFMFLYWTGARKGEVQALTWKDIDFKNNLIQINKTLSNKIKGGGWKITNTKNRKNRTIALLPQLQPTLFEWYRQQKQFTNFNENWFVFGGVKFIANTTIDNYKSNIYKQLNSDCSKQYIEPLTIHQFGRHSHASLLISLGVRDTSIAERLGDTVEVIRKTYAHLFPVYHDEIIEKTTPDKIEKLNMQMEKYKTVNNDMEEEYELSI